jgi:type I restriction enzyme S subunit
LDAIEQAIFLEMFGNPIENTKGWSVGQLKSLARVERGKFTPRPRNDPSYYGGAFPFIQTGDISSCAGRLTLWSQTLNARGITVSRSFPPGTVVIAIVGATLGVTAILDVEVYCPDSVVGIQAYPSKASPEYIERVLRFWRHTAVCSQIGDNKALSKSVSHEAIFHRPAREDCECDGERGQLCQKSRGTLCCE